MLDWESVECDDQ